MMSLFAFAALLAVPAPSAVSPEVVIAAGKWAALREAGRCEAASLALLVARAGARPARLSIGFTPELGAAVHLRRAVPDGSTVMLEAGGQSFLLKNRGDRAWSRGPDQAKAIVAAMRSGGYVRIRARDGQGRRFTEQFALDGAPTAIDAAAACTLLLANGAKSG